MTLVHPSVLAAFWGALFLFYVGAMGYLWLGLTDRKEDFSHYRGQVLVVSSEMLFGEDEGGRIVSVVGTVRNNTQVAWEDVQVEVQFFDGVGRLIDAGLDDSLGGAVLPGSENAFKVVVVPNIPSDRYASHKVFIRYAEEADNAF